MGWHRIGRGQDPSSCPESLSRALPPAGVTLLRASQERPHSRPEKWVERSPDSCLASPGEPGLQGLPVLFPQAPGSHCLLLGFPSREECPWVRARLPLPQGQEQGAHAFGFQEPLPCPLKPLGAGDTRTPDHTSPQGHPPDYAPAGAARLLRPAGPAGPGQAAHPAGHGGEPGQDQ